MTLPSLAVRLKSWTGAWCARLRRKPPSFASPAKPSTSGEFGDQSFVTNTETMPCMPSESSVKLIRGKSSAASFELWPSGPLSGTMCMTRMARSYQPKNGHRTSGIGQNKNGHRTSGVGHRSEYEKYNGK